MSDIAIKLENISKLYRLGEIGTGTISHDLNRWWHRIKGKEDPYAKLGEENNRENKGGNWVWALKDIDFEVKQGEVLGIIGKNGAGKSTLLKILSRVTAPTTGNIKVKGRIASLLEVGTGFHPELTGRENMFLNGAILGMTKSEIKRKFDEIVAFSGVERYIDTPVKRYSSGMYVRLAFAVAAHLESEILIVDEVLAVGDVDFQKKCLGKMGEISNKEGRTVLFVSHNMVSIESLTTSSIIMEHGKINFVGQTRPAIERYFARLSNASSSDLSQRADVKGKGGITFLNAWLENGQGNAIEEFSTGSDVVFCIEFSATESYDSIQVALGVYQSNEVQVTDLWNEAAGYDIDLKGMKAGVIKCKVKNIPFNAGAYYFNIYVAAFNQLLYSVERACDFTVVQGDYFNSGIMPSPNAGVVLVKQDWGLLSK